MNRSSRIVIVVFVAVALAAPLALRLVGLDAEAVENRTLVEWPDASPSGVIDATYFASVDDYLLDHTVGRPQLVRTDAIIDLDVFGDSPSPQVVLGIDGWLFSNLALTKLCDSSRATPEETAAGLAATVAALEARGTRVVWTVAPNKASIYGEYLDDPAAARYDCSVEVRSELLSLTSNIATYVDLFGPLGRLAEGSAEPIYFRNDTHWNQLGAIVMVEALMEAIDATIFDQATVTRAPDRDQTGDLTRLVGRPASEPRPVLVLDRPGVSTESTSQARAGEPPLRTYTSTGGSELYPGVVVVIHDSFMNPALSHLPVFFEHAVFVHWNSYDPELFAGLLASADLVILEVAERGTLDRLGAELGSAEFRAALGSH